MKRVVSCLMMAMLLFSGSIIAVFANEDDHTHEWSDWIVEYDSSCDTHGSEYRYCLECDEYEVRELPLATHEWGDWEIETKATPYKNGVKGRYCLSCDKHQTRSIAKTKLTKKQKKAIKVVKSYLRAAKSYNVKKMNSFFKKKSKKYGYPTKKVNWIYKKYNKKIKWSMVDVTGKGNTITVKVKVTRPNFYNQAYDAFYETCEWSLIHPKASSSKIGNMFSKKYNKKVRACKKRTYTETVTFKVVKSGKKWKIKSKTRAIVDIATAYYNEAVDDAADAFLDDYS